MNDPFLEGLLDDERAPLLAQLLEQLAHRPSSWLALPYSLREPLDTFERRQIALAYSRLLGATEQRIADLEHHHLGDTARRLANALEADPLRDYIDDRGVNALFHQALRWLAEQVDDHQDVFRAGDTCRMGVFLLEDALREMKPDDIRPLLDALETAQRKLSSTLHPTRIPGEWAGVALLWVSALFGLGSLPQDPSATEHFSDWRAGQHDDLG